MILIWSHTWPWGYKTFSCSTQLSTKFQLFIKTKIPTNEETLRYCIYHANKCLIAIKYWHFNINEQVKFYISAELSMEKKFMTSGPEAVSKRSCKVACAYIKHSNPSVCLHNLISLNFPPKETLNPWLPTEHPSKTDQTVQIYVEANLSRWWACMPICTFCWTSAHKHRYP